MPALEKKAASESLFYSQLGIKNGNIFLVYSAHVDSAIISHIFAAAYDLQ